MIYIYRPVHIAYLERCTRRYFYVEKIINEMSLYCISNLSKKEILKKICKSPCIFDDYAVKYTLEGNINHFVSQE